MPEASKKGIKVATPGGNNTPHMFLTSDQFKPVKDWQTGKTYTITIDVTAFAKLDGQKREWDSGNRDLTKMEFTIDAIKYDGDWDEMDEKQSQMMTSLEKKDNDVDDDY